METTHVRSHPKIRVAVIPALIILVLLLGAAAALTLMSNNTAGKVVTHDLVEPLDGAAAARIDLHRYSGDLTIDQLTSSEPVLASGTLPYLENQVLTRAVTTQNGQANLTLNTRAGKASGFSLPWVGCSDDTLWQVHLNPGVPLDITAYSGGGEVKLDLTGMVITRVLAETGGGNVDVVLPDNPADLQVTAKTGAGSVAVHVPANVTARIHVTSGLGNVTIDPRFSKIDDTTYQSPDYDKTANRAEITLNSGAGNVSVTTQ